MSGSVPPGWTFASISDVCADGVVQGPPSDQDVPYVDIGSIDRESKSISNARLVNAATAPLRARQWVKRGDVLVSMTRPNLNAVALIGDAHDGAIASTGFDVLRPIEVLPEWLFSRVRSHAFVADVCEGLQGVVYPAIRPRDVRRHQMPIPPLHEQQRIVEALESYFSRIDDAGANLERVQRNLKRYRVSVLKAAVEGSLVPPEAELARAEGRDYEPALVLMERILEERRRRWREAGAPRKYVEPPAPDTSDLPELPEGWCWATVGAMCRSVADGDHLPPPQTESGTPFLVIGNVRSGQIDFADARCVPESYFAGIGESRRPTAGDILYTVTGSFGIPVKVDTNRPFCVQRHIAILRPVPEISRGYLASALGSTFVFSQAAKGATGTAQKTVGLAVLRRLVIPLPPLREQERILEEVERHLSVVETVQLAAHVGALRCVRLRQSVLKWAFEGKLADQDPVDEPAAKLLERIRAKRQAVPPPTRGKPTRGRPPKPRKT